MVVDYLVTIYQCTVSSSKGDGSCPVKIPFVGCVTRIGDGIVNYLVVR
ncbi:MAG: hypothetical protein A4E25_01442 [Methanobacterium sp. PtaB.Bin024]|nr:MAG: hypothetical protein A4E25_01442 [Methanobacterium sp. PtaB.Bin024]